MGNSNSNSTNSNYNDIKFKTIEKKTVINYTYLREEWKRRKNCKILITKLHQAYDNMMDNKISLTTPIYSDLKCEDLKTFVDTVNKKQIFPSPLFYEQYEDSGICNVRFNLHKKHCHDRIFKNYF